VLAAQDFIDDESSCENYSKRFFYNDICHTLKSDGNFRESSDLKKVNT
jgi:hypothetical protein